MKLAHTLGVLSLLAMAGVAAAQKDVYIAEAMINAPGGDQGFEAVEIAGPASGSLSGWYFMTIDGDGTASGVVDQLVDLGQFGSFGSNGLLLIRDAASTILPGPAAGTNVVVFDFVPDIENGSNTYVLFKWDSAFPLPTVGQDLDTNDDGTLDSAPSFATMSDAVAYEEGDSTAVENQYGDDFGGTNLGRLADPTGEEYTPDALYRGVDCDGKGIGWCGGDIFFSDPTTPATPFVWDPVQNFGFDTFGVDPTTLVMDFGSINVVGCSSQPCYADCDGSGSLNIFDYICFGNAYSAQQSYADCDGNGAFNIFDYICFGNEYAAGCP